MKIVLDECIPVRFRLEFAEYECVTVQYIKAKGMKDGPLLSLIADNADVLITVDATLQSQQNLKKYPRLAFLLLKAKDTDIKTLTALVPRIKQSLKNMKRGQYVVIS